MSAPVIDTAGSQLARDWILEVWGGATPAWTPVLGLKGCSYITEGAEQDDSTIHDGGYGSQIVTGLSARIEASGFRVGGDNAGTYQADPGQDILSEKGRLTGTANFVSARIYRADESPEAYQMTATVKWTDTAATDPNALREFSVTMSSRGKPEVITKPTPPAGP